MAYRRKEFGLITGLYAPWIGTRLDATQICHCTSPNDMYSLKKKKNHDFYHQNLSTENSHKWGHGGGWGGGGA